MDDEATPGAAAGRESREIARAETERGEVLLRERRTPEGPAVLELRVNGVFVMDSAETTSERALARAALELVPDPRNVLIGGLGLGYTAREVLADPRVVRLDVAEIEEAVIGWTREGLVPGSGFAADRRVSLVHGDVAQVVAETRGPTYDLVLLDIDNGPRHLVHDDNAAVYRPPFLAEVGTRLLPDGVLAVWSADEAPELGRALGQVFADTEVRPVPVRLQERDTSYWLYTGRRRS